MERQILLAIHEFAGPTADHVFLLSHQLGTVPCCLVLVLAAAAICTYAKDRRQALVWLALGVSTFVLQAGLKDLVMRPRPDLWTGPITMTSYAFPSGHALAAATFYPLIAHGLAKPFPAARWAAYTCAIMLALFVGFGRLYLGVHWPTDVIAGWALGAAQTVLALRLTRRATGSER